MKRIFIGDIHGRTNWRRIVRDHKDADEIVFFGDYFDPYDHQIELRSLMSNFKKIIEFKEFNDQKVILLLGNHDLHYIADVEPCSRYDFKNSLFIREAFLSNLGHFSVLHQFENVICTHAGLSPIWLDLNFGDWTLPSLGDSIEKLFHLNPNSFAYNTLDKSGFGDDPVQGPMWIRPRSLIMANKEDKRLDSLVQVFGHSQVEDIIESHNVLLNEFDGKFFMVDALEHGGYLVCDNNDIRPKVIN